MAFIVVTRSNTYSIVNGAEENKMQVVFSCGGPGQDLWVNPDMLIREERVFLRDLLTDPTATPTLYGAAHELVMAATKRMEKDAIEEEKAKKLQLLNDVLGL